MINGSSWFSEVRAWNCVSIAIVYIEDFDGLKIHSINVREL